MLLALGDEVRHGPQFRRRRGDSRRQRQAGRLVRVDFNLDLGQQIAFEGAFDLFLLEADEATAQGGRCFLKRLHTGFAAVRLHDDVQPILRRDHLADLPLLGRFFDPVNQLVGFYDVIQRGLAAAQRVFEFLDLPPEVQEDPGARTVEFKRGEVRFEHVTFGYQPGRPVLHDISFTAPAGAKIAVVGSTGSGKTTLVSLLPRFYEPQQGRIWIDGEPIREVRLESLRQAIGIVFQETFPFHGTVAQNIAFARRQIDPVRIRDAARFASIDAFIESLPERYESPVGERGIKLSGGQRQRLSIARMILKDPRIVILDEATSAVDAETERAIQESFEKLMEGRTAFIIAHRLSTIRHADLILVLEQGRLVESGNHEDLLARNGRYAELVASAKF